MMDYLAAHPRVTAVVGFAAGLLAGLAWYGVAVIIAARWNPFA